MLFGVGEKGEGLDTWREGESESESERLIFCDTLFQKFGRRRLRSNMLLKADSDIEIHERKWIEKGVW